jgi:hypothetical protein
MPNKSFFKQVLEPGLMFEDNGSLSGGPKAVPAGAGAADPDTPDN